jgi:hypothetical protein
MQANLAIQSIGKFVIADRFADRSLGNAQRRIRVILAVTGRLAERYARRQDKEKIQETAPG